MNRLRQFLSARAAWAPAFFLVLAFALAGLRSLPAWAVFSALFLGWAALGEAPLAARPPAAVPLFFAWLACASLFSAEPALSIAVLARQALLGLFFLYAAAGEGRKNWLAAVYSLGGVCAAVFLAQKAGGLAPVGLIGANPNYSAAFCAAAFPAAVVAAARATGRGRAAALAGTLLLGAGILVSGSRGALLAALAAAAAGLYACGLRRALAALLLAAAAGALLLPAGSMEGFLKFSDPRAFARPRLWAVALEAALREPFFGFGPGLFGEVFELLKFPYFDGIAYLGHYTPHAHGEFFNLAAEAGFPAALLFLLAAAGALAAGGLRNLQVKLCALAALIQGGTDMIFYSGAVGLLFWGSLGAAGADGVRVFVPGRRLRAAAGALLLAGLVLPPTVWRSGAREKYLAAAYAEGRSGQNPALTLALLRSAALDRPKDPFTAAAEGRALAAAGDLEEAADRFRAALSMEPFYSGARLGLAGVLAAQGRSGGCSAELRLAENRPPAAARNAYQRALLYYDPAEAGKLKKELCGKKRTGGATASRPKTP